MKVQLRRWKIKMKHSLTKRQSQALTLIRLWIKEKQYSPTIQEIADGLGYAHRSAASQLIDKLEQRGHISRVHGATRSISIITDERDELRQLRQVRDAAGVYVFEQEKLREVFDRDQDGQEAKAQGPRVADALQRLKGVMEIST